MGLKHQGSAEYESRVQYDQLPRVDIHAGMNLFDLWVDCALCADAAYMWSELTFIRRMNWVRMARRIAADALSSTRGNAAWYKERSIV